MKSKSLIWIMAGVLLLAMCIGVVSATTGVVDFQKTLGGTLNEHANSIVPTSDGGYIFASDSESSDGDLAGLSPHGGNDIWVRKMHGDGTLDWQKLIGGNGDEAPSSIKQTSDGGYIIAGSTQSSTPNADDIPLVHGSIDVYVVKLNSAGVIEWTETYGGTNWDSATDIQQTSDGGYIFIGETMSDSTYGGDVGPIHNPTAFTFDVWVVKLTSGGAISWQKPLGGDMDDRGRSIQEITGGYILTATTESSNSGDVGPNHYTTYSSGNYDYWVVKLNSSGTIITNSRMLGGSQREGDWGAEIQKTIDGGYILAGSTESLDGDLVGTTSHGNEDFWVVKLNSDLSTAWQKRPSGSGGDSAVSIDLTNDGGYIVGGKSASSDYDVGYTPYYNSMNAWVLKLDNVGSTQWSKVLGADSSDVLSSIRETNPGEYILSGYTYSNDKLWNAWVVKLSTAPDLPVASFTANTISGTAPLPVLFTDTSSGGIPTGRAWFFGDEPFTNTWTEQTVSLGWTGRSDHSSVSLPDGSIVLMGGKDISGAKNDVLWSVNNGVSWQLVAGGGSPAYPARYGHTSVVLPDNSIVLMGGTDGISNMNDVWRSIDNGISGMERKPNDGNGWSARWGHTSVAMPGGSIVLMGGKDDSAAKNDVWQSINKGASWSQLLGFVPWSARYGHSSVVLPDNSIILMGGYDGTNYLNDVWRSTDNGATWTEMTAAAAWSARAEFSSVAMPDGSIILMGGYDGTNYLNDVWRSTDNGATWTEMTAAAAWSARTEFSSVAMPDGSIILMGGYDGSTYLNNIWQFNPVGSSDPSLTHTFATAGTYNVVLTASNTGGYSRATQTITVSGSLTEPAITQPNAIDYGVDTYLGEDPEGNGEQELKVSDEPVPAGTEITLLDGSTVTNDLGQPAWMLFIDEDKNANWGHPCKIVFVYDTGKTQEINLMFPPVEFTDSHEPIALSHEAGKVPLTAGLTSIAPPFAIDPACTPDPQHNFALLIAGGGAKETNHARYYNDLAFMYKTLVKDYKYPKANIKVLMSDGSATTTADRIASYSGNTPVYGNSATDLDGDGAAESWNSATKTNVIAALDSFDTGGGSVLDAGDTLFIFTTGHGSISTPNTNANPATTPNANDVDLLLWGAGEKISDTDFVTALPSAPKITMMMEQCNSGGFVDEFITTGTPTRVLATAANGNQVSHSNDFSYYWITGTAGHDSVTPTPNPANADTNPENKQVSMKEAFDYAYKYDPSGPLFGNVETPTFSEYAANTGASLYLAACAANPSSITVTTPSAAWAKGAKPTVTWTSANLPSSPATYVKVELWKGTGEGKWQATLSSSVLASAGTYSSWTVPTTLPGGLGTDYWIKISTIGSVTPTVVGKSSNFQITGVTTSGTATLTITSTPTGASIDLKDSAGNTAKIGTVEQTGKTTPSTFAGLTSDTYKWTLSKVCYYPSSGSITLLPSASQSKPFTLIAMPAGCENGVNAPYGSIVITSLPKEGFKVYLKPSGASAFIDMGYETPVIQDVGTGEYTVRLEAFGYITQDKIVQVTAGGQARADFELIPESWVYNFEGFSTPVDMNGVKNVAKAGQTIPLKWYLSNVNGPVTDIGYYALRSYPISCGSLETLPSDNIDIYSAGNSGLQNLGNGYWQYNWKTDKNYATSSPCRNMYIEFSHGQTSPEAIFKFIK